MTTQSITRVLMEMACWPCKDVVSIASASPLPRMNSIDSYIAYSCSGFREKCTAALFNQVIALKRNALGASAMSHLAAEQSALPLSYLSASTSNEKKDRRSVASDFYLIFTEKF